MRSCTIPLYSHFRWEGHAKNVHGKVRHQDLVVQKRIKRTTKTADLFRSMDRLTVAERKSMKLQRNNAQELKNFRKETAKYQQFNRSQLIRDQLAQGKNKTQGPNPRGKQLAGDGKPTAKQTRINGQRNVDRTLTNKAETNRRLGKLNQAQVNRTTRPTEKRTTANTRTRVDGRVKTADNSSPTEQLRRNTQLRRDAQLRSEAMRNASKQRQSSNFQSQLLQRQQVQRDLRRSSIPKQSTGNQTVQRNLESLYKQRGITSETLTRSKLAQPR